MAVKPNFVGFFLPTLLWNIVGGMSLVAELSYAQVVGGRQTPSDDPVVATHSAGSQNPVYTCPRNHRRRSTESNKV
jgi:hypothetical protein